MSEEPGRGWGAVNNFLPMFPHSPFCLSSIQAVLSSEEPTSLPRGRLFTPLTPTLRLGGLEQAGQFDHLAPYPAPRCLRTPSIDHPFPAPFASPSSSVLCLSVSPPSLPLSSLSPPPSRLPPSLAPSHQPSFLPSLLSSWWAPRWRWPFLLCPPTWARRLGTSPRPGLSGCIWGLAGGEQVQKFPPLPSLCPPPLLSSIPQAAKEGAWTGA